MVPVLGKPYYYFHELSHFYLYLTFSKSPPPGTLYDDKIQGIGLHQLPQWYLDLVGPFSLKLKSREAERPNNGQPCLSASFFYSDTAKLSAHPGVHL